MSVISVIETVKKIAPGIKFKSAEHMLFFGENVINTKSERDTYRKAFFYTVGILPQTRACIDSLYDFQDNCPKLDGFSGAWQTSGTIKMCRLALNLYNGFHQNGTSWHDLENVKDGSFTPYKLFATSDAFYMLEAVKVRYPDYTTTPYVVLTTDKKLISLDDVRKIIKEEMDDIAMMKPEENENDITVDVMKQHYSAECRIILNRITDFVREQEATE